MHMKGQLASNSDVDYYKFSVDKTVKLSITFSSEKNDGVGWIYELESEDGSLLGGSECSHSVSATR